MLFTTVVLPTPGPPVMTVTLPFTEVETAWRCEEESCSPVCSSTQGIAFTVSISPQGILPVSSLAKHQATPFSERYKGVTH